jgi:hypothetical protein
MKWIILTEIICVVLFPSNAFAQRFSMDPITVSNETSTVITLSAADAIDITQYLMNSNARISIQMDNACQTALVQYENQLLHVRDIHIKDHLAYIADSINGLLIVDIESPHMPKQLSQCKIPGTANLITINASTAFITDQDKGIYMIDISDPSFPQFMHTVKTSGTVLDIIAYHQLLMIADSKEGLRIYDLTSTESPEIMATFQQSAAITVSGDYIPPIYGVIK